MTTFCLLISKGFNTSGFATQIGSIAYLAPILFSLVVRVIEIKHNFAKAANEPEDVIGVNEKKYAKGDTPMDRFKKFG